MVEADAERMTSVDEFDFAERRGTTGPQSGELMHRLLPGRARGAASTCAALLVLHSGLSLRRGRATGGATAEVHRPLSPGPDEGAFVHGLSPCRPLFFLPVRFRAFADVRNRVTKPRPGWMRPEPIEHSGCARTKRACSPTGATQEPIEGERKDSPCLPRNFPVKF